MTDSPTEPTDATTHTATPHTTAADSTTAKALSPFWAIADDLGKLVLRGGFGLMMAIGHGWAKASDFEKTAGFMDGMMGGLPGWLNATLATGAELGCALLLVIGLGTRLAALPLIFTMGYAAFVFHGEHPMFAQGGPSKESAVVYLIAFAAIALLGPGRFSFDKLLFGRGR